MSDRTLLLNNWFIPIQILRWQDAVKMKYEGTVDVVAEYSEEVCSPSITWNMPAVVRLHRKIKLKNGIKYSRENIYKRDNYTCQYCKKHCSRSEITCDHVVPRHAGGRTSWENIVTACWRCNIQLKRGQTCDEAGMWPITQPVRPRWLPVASSSLVNMRQPEPEWLPYLVPA